MVVVGALRTIEVGGTLEGILKQYDFHSVTKSESRQTAVKLQNPRYPIIRGIYLLLGNVIPVKFYCKNAISFNSPHTQDVRTKPQLELSAPHSLKNRDPIESTIHH